MLLRVVRRHGNFRRLMLTWISDKGNLSWKTRPDKTVAEGECWWLLPQQGRSAQGLSISFISHLAWAAAEMGQDENFHCKSLHSDMTKLCDQHPRMPLTTSCACLWNEGTEPGKNLSEK
jgi:hypothetical protein